MHAVDWVTRVNVSIGRTNYFTRQRRRTSRSCMVRILPVPYALRHCWFAILRRSIIYLLHTLIRTDKALVESRQYFPSVSSSSVGLVTDCPSRHLCLQV